MKKSTNLTTGVAGNNVRDALRYHYDVEALPRLVVDWNMNRYTVPTVDNILPEVDFGHSVELFPISSVTDVNRPGRKGIAKALVGQSIVSAKYQDPGLPKFYVGDQKDIYKYWTSPRPTKVNGTFPTVAEVKGSGSDTTSSVQPAVKYDRAIKVNKIVIRTENTWASPLAWSIQVATNEAATNWTTVGNNVPTDADGIAVIYYTGSWGTSSANLTSTTITGVKLIVNSMGPGKTLAGTTTKYRTKYTGTAGNNAAPQIQYTDTTGANSNFNLIAIEPHYEVDLTDRLISANDNFDMSEFSQIYPIGTLTSNGASVTLDNSDTLFDKDNPLSPYYGLLDANAEFNLQYVYDINGVKHSVQAFRMFSGDWSSSDSTTDIDLEDSSKFLKEIKPNSTLYENKTVTELIWRILDSVGFHDYEIGVEDIDPEQFVVPIFWTTGEDTAWEVLDELAKSSQTAIYFDARNKLQVRTREAAFKDTVPDWNMYGQKEGINLPDILTLNQTDEMEANKVVVSYRDTEWRRNSYGQPGLSRVWDGDADSLVVRSSPISNTLAVGAATISLASDDAAVWPYATKVNIDSEILSYDAKQYAYYTDDPNNPNNHTIRNEAWVVSEDERKALDNKTNIDYRWMNTWTGLLRIKERGLWNSQAVEHTTNNAAYAGFVELDGSGKPFIGGHNQNIPKSTMEVNTMNNAFYGMAKTGDRTSYNRFGTKVKFNSDGSWNQMAGIFAHANAGALNTSGYYFNIIASKWISDEARAGGWHEVQVYSRTPSGGYINHGNIATREYDMNILEDYWYELDMDITRGSDFFGAFDFIRCFINGKLVFAYGIRQVQAPTATFGMFTRYKTNASFEYCYALDRPLTGTDLTDFSFYDLKAGGFRGNLYEREFVYDMNTGYKKRVKEQYTPDANRMKGMVFDDFTPYMHEIREFDVKFDPAPVQRSELLSTNNFYAATLEYQGTPWGAHFIVANTAREHAILSGEDTLIYSGSGASVTQVFTILGRDLDIKEGQTVEAKNEQFIRIRGLIETEIASDWIQSKAMAQAIADWIVAHWSKGVDQVEAEVFGNPLLEVGDVVDVSFVERHMSPATHKYFVVATSTNFDQGLSTTLTLRRVR